MTSNIKNYFEEIKPFEAGGSDTMDWAEGGRNDINELIVEKFSLDDWICLSENYKNQSNSIKGLIVSHIHLFKNELAMIQLQILTEIINDEKGIVAFDALMTIVHRFVGFNISGETNHQFLHVKLSGVFASDNNNALINKFFTPIFKNNALAIAEECGEHWKIEILEFLKIFNDRKDI